MTYLCYGSEFLTTPETEDVVVSPAFEVDTEMSLCNEKQVFKVKFQLSYSKFKARVLRQQVSLSAERNFNPSCEYFEGIDATAGTRARIKMPASTHARFYDPKVSSISFMNVHILIN